jgi:hypothetical protein
MKRNIVPALAMALTMAACAGAGSPDESPGGPVVPSVGAVPSLGAVPSIGDVGGVPDDMVDDVLQLAVDETGVSRDDISVVTAEAVTWPDGSIGCPQDDMMYTQALVPGYRVILEVAGEELAFHASQEGDFRPCATPAEPVDDGTVDR